MEVSMEAAATYLTYVINKAKEQAHAQQMQLVQQQTQGNAQAGQMIEQAKRKTLMMQHQADMELENLKGQWQLKIEGMKKNMDYAEGGTAGRGEEVFLYRAGTC
jgi:hypothetical protein